MKRAPVRLLLECGVFGAFVGVVRQNAEYVYHVDYVSDKANHISHRKDAPCC